MPATGEKPGKGTYKCDNCGTRVAFDDVTDMLPSYPKCYGTEFTRMCALGPGLHF